MVTCPNCGTENEDGSKFCVGCSVSLPEAKSVSSTSVQQMLSPAGSEKTPAISALLSFFLLGGAGQIYNGQFMKGFAIILGLIVFYGLSFVIIPIITSLLGPLALLNCILTPLALVIGLGATVYGTVRRLYTGTED